MSAAPSPETDPRPLPPKEPELEDCCGTGCVNCVFDMYQIALENYERALKAWEERHPGQAGAGA
ncbi:oxidoreductase-like domain-containing protein [Massilia sp. 2TAF26]|uniref:oxidoreductase-like domain-containing protein n=1 Tax=Massilia sp. 2TAF26 TaxID=3233012 RepID=UPI003F9C61F1